MKFCKRHRRRSGGAENLHLRIQSDQRLGKIAWIRRDAMVTDAENRVAAIDALHRGAARPGIPLVAGFPARIAKVGAARALQNVAAERRHVADLSARGKLKRLREHRIVALDRGVIRDVGHAREPS